MSRIRPATGKRSGEPSPASSPFQTIRLANWATSSASNASKQASTPICPREWRTSCHSPEIL